MALVLTHNKIDAKINQIDQYGEMKKNFSEENKMSEVRWNFFFKYYVFVLNSNGEKYRRTNKYRVSY